MNDVPRHQCLIYSGDPQKQLARLAASIHTHLKANYRCLYLNSPLMIGGIRSYLIASGLNVSDEVFKRRLILSSDQSHLTNGTFDPSVMLSALREAIADALGEGHAGLWASGDMAWEFGNSADYSRLLEYERGLERLFEEQPALRGVCQYHEDVLPKGASVIGIAAHQAVYVNETLSKINSKYVAPA